MASEVITQSAASKIIGQLDFLPGFPRSEHGLRGLIKAFVEIVGDEEHAQWLADEVARGCARFPAPIEMRRIFTMKFPAADGKSCNDCDCYDYMDHRAPSRRD